MLPNKGDNMKELITSWEKVPVVIDIGYVANLLRVSIETVRKACINGSLPAFKVNGMWRINKKDLMIFCGEAEK